MSGHGIVPPFFKGRLGGISQQLFLALPGIAGAGNPPRSPFFKGGSVCDQKAGLKIRVHGKQSLAPHLMRGKQSRFSGHKLSNCPLSRVGGRDGGLAGISASKLAAREATARCSGQCALQGRVGWRSVNTMPPNKEVLRKCEIAALPYGRLAITLLTICGDAALWIR